MTFRSSVSDFLDLDQENWAKLPFPPSLSTVEPLVLFLLLIFIPHLVGEGEAPKLPIPPPAGPGRTALLPGRPGAPDSRAAVSMSNACRFLSGPSLPLPVLLGASVVLGCKV